MKTTDDDTSREALIERLRVAMLGTTDGDFIEPESDVPAGEMFRLAAEWVDDVVLPLVVAHNIYRDHWRLIVRYLKFKRAEARTVTAGQVEAAARAMWGWGAGRSWDSSQGPEFDRYRDHLRRRARAALTAAGFTVPEEVQP